MRPGLLVDRPRPDELIQTVSISPDKHRVVADARLQEMYDQTTTRMVEDSLSNLYVAMTRAARRLEMILPWVDPRKRVTSPTAADLVRGGLPEEELHAPDESNVIWSHPDNAVDSDWAETDRDEAAPAEAPEPPIRSLKLADGGKRRSLPRRSPSGEEGGRRVQAGALFRPRNAARRGTMVHAWLEDLAWLEEFKPDERQLLEQGAPLEPDLDRRRAALEELKHALTQDQIRDALSRSGCRAPEGTKLEVATERTFSVVLTDDGQEQLWSGSIDRLVLARRDDQVVWAEVLDYKTDQVNEEQLQDRAEYYRPQLERYARVVALQTGIAVEEISCRLLFLSAARVVTL